MAEQDPERGAVGEPATAVHIGLRKGRLGYAGFAVAGASAGAIVLAGFEVLKAQPVPAFALLQSWGPGFLIALFIISVLGKFFEGLIQALMQSFRSVTREIQSGAEASGRTADALTKLSDQGGKQGEKVERLAIYAARQIPEIYARFDEVDAALKVLSAKAAAFQVDQFAEEGAEARAGDARRLARSVDEIHSLLNEPGEDGAAKRHMSEALGGLETRLAERSKLKNEEAKDAK